MLYAETAGSGPRLVMLHGFAQNRRCWGTVAESLAERHEVVLVDAPGHGRSHALQADLWEGARLVADVGDEADYVGYSMGGRIALHLALNKPELVRSLVLLAVTPGIADLDGRRTRAASDERLAVSVEGDGIETFLQRWLAQPIFSGLTPAAAAYGARCENTVEGLAASLRLAGVGNQDVLWDRLSSLDMPVLVMAGDEDGMFARLAEKMVDAIGANAEVALVPDAGHSAHLEQPGAFVDLVEEFLGRRSAGISAGRVPESVRR